MNIKPMSRLVISVLAAMAVPSLAVAQVQKASYTCTAYQSNLDKKWAYEARFDATRDRDGFFRAPTNVKVRIFKLETFGGEPPRFDYVGEALLNKQAGATEKNVTFRGFTGTSQVINTTFVSDEKLYAFDRVAVTHAGRKAWGHCTITPR